MFALRRVQNSEPAVYVLGGNGWTGGCWVIFTHRRRRKCCYIPACRARSIHKGSLAWMDRSKMHNAMSGSSMGAFVGTGVARNPLYIAEAAGQCGCHRNAVEVA